MERESPSLRIEDMNARSANGRPLNVLIAGGGVAGLEALLALKRHAEERVSIELLAPEPQFWYRPLSVAEPFGLGHVHGLDLSGVADDCGRSSRSATSDPSTRIVTSPARRQAPNSTTTRC